MISLMPFSTQCDVVLGRQADHMQVKSSWVVTHGMWHVSLIGNHIWVGKTY